MIELLSDMSLKKLIIKEARPKTAFADLFDRMNAINKTKVNTLQAFDYESIASRTHLLGAYINAMAAFASHSNKAKSMSMEMLLFAAMTDQIGVAIGTMGARGDSKIIIFTNSKKALDGVKDLLTDIKDFDPTPQHARKALMKLGITNAKDPDRLLLQRMATSRLKP
jgi:tRNA threonylcarbamoyladenosine modification (KEOPS) complex Cgi121 subunit